MILLTGATGVTGTRVLDRLLGRGHDVRCLVRDPMRLGSRRVAVGLAHWSLTDQRLPGGALRGVDTLVHLAGPLHDEASASLEELNVTAVWRLADAAASAGVDHVVFVSALGAGAVADCRFLRAKHEAERVLAGTGVAATVLAPSLVIARGHRWAWMAHALSILPLSPLPTGTGGRSAPVAAADLADAVVRTVEDGPPSSGARRLEICGPQELTLRRLLPELQAALGRRRRGLPLPAGVLRAAAAALERPGVADREELALLGCDTTGRRGTSDLQGLGVTPHTIREALAD